MQYRVGKYWCEFIGMQNLALNVYIIYTIVHFHIVDSVSSCPLVVVLFVCIFIVYYIPVSSKKRSSSDLEWLLIRMAIV